MAVLKAVLLVVVVTVMTRSQRLWWLPLQFGRGSVS